MVDPTAGLTEANVNSKTLKLYCWIAEKKKNPRKITKTDHTNKLNRQASWQTEHAV